MMRLILEFVFKCIRKLALLFVWGMFSVVVQANERVNSGLIAEYHFNAGYGDIIRDVTGETGTDDNDDPGDNDDDGDDDDDDDDGDGDNDDDGDSDENDDDNRNKALDLRILNPDKVRWLSCGGLRIEDPTLIHSKKPAKKIARAINNSNEFSIETWLVPASRQQTGPARIASISKGPYSTHRNFLLGQKSKEYFTELRSPLGNNYQVELQTRNGQLQTELTHVVYTRDDDGKVSIYINGQLKESKHGDDADLRWRKDAYLNIANEIGADRPWLGDYYLLAIYKKALDHQQIIQNFQAGIANECNKPPVAVFQLPHSAGVVPFVVELDGESSYDLDGEIIQYHWDLGNGITSAEEEVDYTYTEPGIYTITLTVTDDNGESASVSHAVQVSQSDIPSEIIDPIVLYKFNEGSGDKVRDLSTIGEPLDLKIQHQGRTSWLECGGLSIDQSTFIKSLQPGRKISNAIKTSNAITVEAWITPDKEWHHGHSRIVTLSKNRHKRNFSLDQTFHRFKMRLRTSRTGNDASYPNLTSGRIDIAKELTHVVFTRDDEGEAKFYVNGQLTKSGFIGGYLFNWKKNFHLGLANEFNAHRAWLGDFHFLAIYDLALDENIISQHYSAGVEDGCSVNNNPVITSTPITEVIINQAYQYQLVATDVDGDVLDYQLSVSPTGMQIDNINGLITWQSATLGEYPVTVEVRDLLGGIATQSYILKVVADPLDRDGDGVPNDQDAFPDDPTEWSDLDGDGVGDNSDPDRDGDGVPNTTDVFPDDPAEWSDLDGDGIGDNSDPDRDGDGVFNTEDAFPDDPTEWSDLDGDGIGDNSDPDRDGDGVDNNADLYPDDPSRYQLPAVSNLSSVFDGLQVMLSWGAIADSANLAAYRVYRKEAGGILALLAELTAVEISYADKQIANAKGYEYHVTGVDIKGNEGAYNQSSIFIAYNNLTVSGFLTQRNNEPVMLAWEAVVSSLPVQIRYHLYRGTGTSAPLPLLELSEIQYTDNNVIWNESYTYQIAVLADFVNPFTQAIQTVEGPLSDIVVVNSIPPLTLELPDTVKVDDFNWQLTVNAGEQIIVNGRINEALGPLEIIAQSNGGDFIINSADGDFSLLLNLLQGSVWSITASETTVNNRSVNATLHLLSDSNAPVVAIDPVNYDGLAESILITGNITDSGNTNSDNSLSSAYGQSDRFPGQEYPLALGTGNTFQLNIPLAYGVNQITVFAKDAATNTGQSSVTIQRESPLLPAIEINSPMSGSAVTTSTVNITGTVYSQLPHQDMRVEVGAETVFFQSPQANHIYPFSFNNIELQEGVNQITATVVSPGNSSTASVIVIYNPEDNTGGSTPHIQMDPTLVDAVLSNEPILISGTVNSEVELQGVSINFQPATISSSGNQQYTFSYLLDLSTAPGNEFQIPVTATDINGVSSTVMVSLKRDTDSPVITITTPGIALSPVVNTIVDTPFILRGEVVDVNLSQLTVNGQSVSVSSGTGVGVYTFSVDVNVAFGQDQVLLLTALDKAGNSSTKELIIHIDSPLTIEWIRPKADEQLQVNNLHMNIDVTARLNGVGVDNSVRVRFDNGAAVPMVMNDQIGTATVPVSVKDGDHQLHLEVLDVANNIVGRSSINISLLDTDNIPLEVQRTQPVNGADKVNVGEIIALYFNRPINPEKLSIEVKETVHGKTWDLSQYEGTDPLSVGGVDALVEVHRDQELIAGNISIFPGESVVSYHLKREYAYGADVFVNVNYENQLISKFTFKTEVLPTLLYGSILNQFNQPISNVEVQIADTQFITHTDSQGGFNFGFGDNPELRVPSGPQRIVFNPGLKNIRMGSSEILFNIQEGVVNRMGTGRLPLLVADTPFIHVSETQNSIYLLNGALQLSAPQLDLVFPDGGGSGGIYAQFLLEQSISHKSSMPVRPLWVYAIQPSGIEIRGDVGIQLTAPSYNGGNQLLDIDGAYVVLVGLDADILQLVPVGVGLIENNMVKSVGEVHLKRLDYIGYAYVSDEQQELLKNYSEGLVEYYQLIAELSAVKQ